MSATQGGGSSPTLGALLGGTTVNVQMMSQLVATLANFTVALNGIAQALTQAIGPGGFSAPVRLAGFTVAGLPAVTLTNVGQIAFATNALNNGETTGAGSGTVVQVTNHLGTARWIAIWSGLPPVT